MGQALTCREEPYPIPKAKGTIGYLLREAGNFQRAIRKELTRFDRKDGRSITVEVIL